MSAYVSEFTLFMREMMIEHPEWADQQRQGRALLWDRKVNFEELQRFTEANVLPGGSQYNLTRLSNR